MLTNPKRLDNLTASMASLREYVEEPAISKRNLAGTVFGFVRAFELACKCLQDQVAGPGYAERGPKPVLSAAFQAGFIPVEGEETWSQMLADRNLASRIYNQNFANALAERIRQSHVKALEALVHRLAS